MQVFCEIQGGNNLLQLEIATIGYHFNLNVPMNMLIFDHLWQPVALK